MTCPDHQYPHQLSSFKKIQSVKIQIDTKFRDDYLLKRINHASIPSSPHLFQSVNIQKATTAKHSTGYWEYKMK